MYYCPLSSSFALCPAAGLSVETIEVLSRRRGKGRGAEGEGEGGGAITITLNFKRFLFDPKKQMFQ